MSLKCGVNLVSKACEKRCSNITEKFACFSLIISSSHNDQCYIVDIVSANTVKISASKQSGLCMYSLICRSKINLFYPIGSHFDSGRGGFGGPSDHYGNQGNEMANHSIQGESHIDSFIDFLALRFKQRHYFYLWTSRRHN